MTSIVNFIACFQDDYFDSIVNEEKWEELVQLAKGRTSNGKFIKKYDFDKITVLNFIDYYKLFSITPIQVVETKPIEEISKTQSETEENPFWIWLKNEGFMERVINQLKEYTNSITNEAGLNCLI